MANYWEDDDLILSRTSAKTAASKALVTQFQTDLIKLGYLSGHADGGFGHGTERALKRFQRHAARVYRMPQPDVSSAQAYPGDETGILDPATASEMRTWITKGWKLPLDRFQLTAISAPGASGKLRSDAAAAWSKIVGIVTSKGGTLAGPYGDTARGVHTNSKVGASKYSFHYSGRAVDINQALGGGKGQRYFILQDPSGSSMYWRLYCSTDKQDGSQGTYVRAKTVNAYQVSGGTTYALKEGYYIDLTATIMSTGTFERIPAQTGWQAVYNKTEWWHFQYKLDKQPTFLDEMELVGYGEAKLKAGGWTSEQMLDHAPG